MSDQVFDGPDRDSIGADRDAADDDAVEDETLPPADGEGSVLTGSPLDDAAPETSHDADVEAGFDEEN